MQVKKFEAPTIQEALENIKRELGPEAIILQTKKHKRGFGLMSRASVEITAAVSERSMQKKEFSEKRISDRDREAFRSMPADKQAEIQDRYVERHQATHPSRNANGGALAAGPATTASRTRSAGIDALVNQMSERVDVNRSNTRKGAAAQQQAPAKKITATRYIDIDPDQVPATQVAPARAPVHQQQRTHAPLAPPSNPLAMSVEEEVRHLKRMIEELKTAQEREAAQPTNAARNGAESSGSVQALGTPALQDAFDQLILGGVDKRIAFNLIKRAGFELGESLAQNPDLVVDQLAAEIMEGVETSSPLAGIFPRSESNAPAPGIIALVGPTGVGKTTTVAKIASEAILKRNMKVGLINLDTYKVAAFDQLGTYAKILNVPFRSVANFEELGAAIRDFQSLDLILIDTTGRSQRDTGSLQEMHATLQAIPGVRTQLVLSATTRDNELYDMANRFAVFRPQGLIVSKLDEASIYGSIYNVAQKVKLPLLYFTTGQRVPEDIEEASKERVAALVLDI